MKQTALQDQLRATIEQADSTIAEKFAKADTAFIRPVSKQKNGIDASAKVVRDTFSLPPDEHEQIEKCRARAAQAGRIASRSEMIRVGLQMLKSLSDEELVEALGSLRFVKPGRKT